MKFNPYPVLLTTGALMLGTVLLAQTGSSVALLKAGAASVNKDVSSFAVGTFAPVSDRPLVARPFVAREDSARPTRLAALDHPE